jgi:hypothetical protein
VIVNTNQIGRLMNFSKNMAREQAIKACQFWAGLEYMNLATAPEADERRRVFRIGCDADLPWRFQVRKSSLRGTDKKFKAQIAYCGIYSKRDYTVSLRNLLGSTSLVPQEMRKVDDGAVLLMPLDDTGRVCGEVFVSSMPWMMARIQNFVCAPGHATEPDLSGFNDFHQSLMQDVRQLLVQLQLIREEDVRGQDRQQDKQSDAGALRAGQVVGQVDMLPLELAHVDQLLKLIWTRCGWCPDWDPYVAPTVETTGAKHGVDHLARIKVVTLTRYKDRVVDLKAMNSMVANDVLRVRRLLASGESVGPALLQYLKLTQDPQRIDLRDDDPDGGLGHFESALSPKGLPSGAWPDFPLVTAQQFAVNMSRECLTNGGLFGVNGPPGTGKSTLLRDVVADLIVSRAEVLASYNDPLAAFPSKGEIEGHKYGYWVLDSALHGHGVVVASSNNGAVENVIKELPKLTKPMSAAKVTYFSKVSDSIAAPSKDKQRAHGSTWGLVAALLGSAEKKRAFLSRFWFEEAPKVGETPDPMRLVSLKGLVERGDHSALPWSDARIAFNEKLRQFRLRAESLHQYIQATKQATVLRQTIHNTVEHLDAARAAHDICKAADLDLQENAASASMRLNAYKKIEAAVEVQDKAESNLRKAQQATSANACKDAVQAEADAQSDVDMALRQTTLALASKPGFFESILNWGAGRQWRARLQQLGDEEKAAQSKLAAAKRGLRKAQADAEQVRDMEAQLLGCGATTKMAMDEAMHVGLTSNLAPHIESALNLAVAESLDQLNVAQRRATESLAKYQALVERIAAMKVELAGHEARLKDLGAQLGPLQRSFLETMDLLTMSDQERQLCVAYNDPELRTLRVEVFRLAVQVNESFVVGAWKRLSGTLSAFVDYQAGKISAAQATDAAAHLWNAFFLVVPVVSSTFASFDRLFSGLGQEALGMLLIDEAGQSTPQNAVGAIWRAKRVIAVGDPLQLEPVVAQPIEAVSAWREWTDAAKHWVPPMCSTQILADDMTRYGTELNVGGTEERKVWVGSPLRVHRRCLNPMFDAANEIAYANLMVHGVADDTNCGDWLGIGQWFDVRGAGVGHWVQAQGEFALELVFKLLDTEKLSGELKNEKGDFHINVITPYTDVGSEFTSMLRSAFKDVDDIHKMAGTVHTFQGKEADVVILLLGGNPEKPGAVSSFAGNEQSPNLLNVALTRAKKRLYVVGDKQLWTDNSATFRRLARRLDQHTARLEQRAQSGVPATSQN